MQLSGIFCLFIRAGVRPEYRSVRDYAGCLQ